MRANGDGSFSVGKSPGELDQTWRMVSLDNGYFVAEFRDPDDGGNSVLLLAKAASDYLVVHTVDSAQITAAAAKTGLRLAPPKNGSPMIGPGASKALVLGTYKEISAKAGLDGSLIYTRRGGFVEPEGEQNSPAAMERLLHGGGLAPAIAMGRYLSDRGDIRAQLQLLAIAHSGKLDRTEGIRHGLRAVRSGRVEGETALGELYALPLSRNMPIDSADADQGLFWLSMAQLNKAGGEHLEPVLGALTSAVCSKNTAPDKFANCMDATLFYWTMRARVHRSGQSNYGS